MQHFDDDHDQLDDGNATYTVAEIADAINGSLRASFSEGVWVTGEISGWSGRGTHAYFNLTGLDDDGKKVQLAVSLFAYSRNRIRPILMKHQLELADGVKVRVFGHLDFFGGNGKLSLKMSAIDPRFTMGDLAAQRDELIRKLAARGLLQRNRNVPTPVAPLRVGLVTSDGSAAWHDFTQELSGSGFGFHVTLIDCRVQGDTAVREVTDAIRTFARHQVDVVAVVRGGGSRTELAVFDHEAIAVAIAESPHPVFTGIGHEIDRSVADDVAHTASKTPTACAVAIVQYVVQFMQQVEAQFSGIVDTAQELVTDAASGLVSVGERIRTQVVAAVDRGHERLDVRAGRLTERVQRALTVAGQELDRGAVALGRTPQRLAVAEQVVETRATMVRLLDPATTLARGYTITRTADGRTVRATDLIGVGDTLITTFANGTATSRVEELS
jgi:exodeoxyribonuclease VII large subunit